MYLLLIGGKESLLGANLRDRFILNCALHTFVISSSQILLGW
jgi:hypothetical protein